MVGQDPRLQQIERIAASPVLHEAEALCHLLRYLGAQAIEHPGVPVKEYELATRVFGRPSDFDPRVDSSVRVQIGRLRTKLAEYYREIGSNDEIVMELPRGAYTVSFHPKTATVAAALPQPDAPPAPPSPASSRSHRLSLWWFLAGLASGAACVTAWVVLTLPGQPAVPPTPPREIRSLWQAFLDSPAPPLVVYSNAQFVGRPETGMRYFQPGIDTPPMLMDHYTGVGEVIAIHSLSRIFLGFGRELRVKRGQLFTWDEAQNVNLVFVGSPSENLSLRGLPTTPRFVFDRVAEGTRKGDLVVMDRRPEPNKPSRYHASEGLPVAEDYALISLLPGLAPGRSVMMLAGITTIGTQGAAEFVCRPVNASQILEKLSIRPPAPVTPFEALVRIKVSGGVPVQMQIAAFQKGDKP